MGAVIYLSQGHARFQQAVAKHEGRGRTALVLGGGGITGAAYHLGVLNAMSAMSRRVTVNDFDLFVGTSAGAVVAACLANGIPPDELLRAQIGQRDGSIPEIRADEILMPERKGLLRSAVRWPLGVLGAIRRYAAHPLTTSLIDGFGALAEGLPPGLYTTDGTEAWMRRLFTSEGRSNRFHETKRELLITATDLDAGTRMVFGASATADVEISDAAAASTAIPLLYSPRRIGERVYLDGGLRSTTNIDVAIAHGATLIVCINPLVPYVHNPGDLLPSATGLASRDISEKGFPHIAAQTFRIMATAQVEKEIELITHAHPEVDIVLIEPRRDDEHLFVFNLMDYASRERVARHAFESVAIDLVTHFPDYAKVGKRHGIKLDRQLLLEQLQEIVSGAEPKIFGGNVAASDRRDTGS
ncbi:MAG TPA: patatin-like phospholipase family protein [Actinomycetota bacterium]|nr:patatin-like phospholipase family protein [Actinomycetota bacterium]